MRNVIGSLCVSLCLAVSAWAQADANKGSISGTVFDPNQAAIPNAKVRLSSSATGLVRETTTNEAGQYRLVAVDPGVYQLKAEASGFAAATAENVMVSVGGSVLANLTVSLQPTTQTIEVSSTLLQVTESNPSQTLDQRAIRDLPINGRRFQDFATLTPTVQVEPSRQQLSFAGQRGINSNVMVDGTDYNEPFFGGIRGGERSNFAFTIPQTAIQEFQAVTTGYSAEYGRSTGGILNAITRSGHNQLHGDAFYQIRHKELGLKNPLNQQSLETQHQFGGGMGGPIRRDKLFFFGAAEQQFARFPRLVRFATLDTVGAITPDIAPAYNHFRSLEQPFNQTNNATAALGRLDYQFGGGSRLTGRYNYSRNTAENAATTGVSLNPQTNFAVSNNGTEKDNTHTVVGQLTSVFGPMLVNDLRAQYSREERPRDANVLSPTVEASVIGRFGTVSFLPNTASNYRWQFADGLTLQRGSHTFKLGLDFDYLGAAQTFGFNQFGLFSLSGSNVRTLLQILSRSGGAEGNRFDDASVTYRRQIGNLALQTNMTQLAFFGQDSFRVTNNFTLSYGLRWEGQFNPSPATNNDFLVTNVRDFVFPLGRVNPAVIRSQLDQWGPRLGFAWNVRGNGKTVVRANTGIYYAQSPIILYAGPLNNFRLPPGDVSLDITPSGTNTVYRQLLAAGFDLNRTPLDKLPILTAEDVRRIAGPERNPFFRAAVTTTSGNNYRNPRAFQVTAGFEQEIAHGLVADYQFNHVNTVHLERNIDYNVPLPFLRPSDASQRPFFGLRSGTPRPNPNLGSVTVRDSGARSDFYGHTLRLQYRRERLQLATSYTLSYNKSDDDNERSSGGTTYQNPFDLRREFNWSALDARHQFGGYTVWQGPLGIELSGLFRWRSALPIDPTTGADTSELLAGSTGNRPLEAPGVPFLRNSFRNRDFKAVDARFLKNFRITERSRLQFSCEMFNLFNWSNMQFTFNAYNYGLGLLTNGQPAPVDPRFRRLRTPTGAYDASTTAQQGTPFQAQLGLRLIF